MENYDSMTTTIHRLPSAWYNFPQTFTVPKGWKYMTYADRGFTTVWGDTDIDLYCEGDWLEMVNPEGSECIRYELY